MSSGWMWGVATAVAKHHLWSPGRRPPPSDVTKPFPRMAIVTAWDLMAVTPEGRAGP